MNLEFKPIEIDNIGEMLPFYGLRRNKTCDSVFLESFVWKEYYHVSYAIWEGKALLWLMESNGKCFSAMPLCKEEDLPGAFHAIEQYFNENLGYPLVINLADEAAVEMLKLPKDQYLVEEQVDSRDYLYTGEAMRTLAGKKLHKKKNRVNVFKREYEGRYEYRRLCCSDSHEVWTFLDRWREQKGEDVEEHLDYEVRGIHDILKNCSDLFTRMGGVFVDDELQAFTIGSYNPVENMAVIHIEKANPEINGLYQFINQQFLLEEFPEVEWVNREDDMGLEGLRKAKQSYYPADFARKYLVEQLLDGQKGYHWAEQIGNTIPGSQMVYLEGEDKKETMNLWRSAFSEDSECFVQYYYEEKTRDNRVLVKKENGLILSMTHLNPYPVHMKGQDWTLDYIVGVATEEARRREGHFRDLFLKLLADQQMEGRPMTYLVPVNPKVYEPLGFVMVGDVPQLELSEAGNSLARTICRDVSEDCERAAAYMEQWLSARYEVFTGRDSAYVSRTLKELASEGGKLEFLWDGERLVGLLARWGEDLKEQRFLYAEDAYVVKRGENPWNMGRITDAVSCLRSFSLKQGNAPFTLSLKLHDPLLEANNGYFIWKLSEQGSEVYRQETVAAGAASELTVEMEITELLLFLLGRKSAQELWPQLSEQSLSELLRIDTVNGICLDEIV